MAATWSALEEEVALLPKAEDTVVVIIEDDNATGGKDVKLVGNGKEREDERTRENEGTGEDERTREDEGRRGRSRNTKKIKRDKKIHEAAKLGRVEQLEQLMKLRPQDLGQQDQDGRTPLHLAAECGNVATVKLLLSRDEIGVAKRNKEEQTALHLAARGGHGTVVKELMEAGASMQDRDVHGYTPLHWTAKKGYSKCCTNLLELGADVNAVDKKGNTPLHLFCATWRDKLDCLQVLLCHQADVNAQNDQGETPFHLCHKSPIEMAQTFKQEAPYIDLKIIDKKGRTALHYAAERRNPEYVDLVLKLETITKKVINLLDAEGKTALHIAITKKAKNSCYLLLSAGANGSQSCGNVGSALHLVAQQGLTEICEHMMNKGVIISKNKAGQTPLHLAAAKGHSDCCQYLKKKGAVLAAKDTEGMTALHHAAKHAHDNCCQALLKMQPNLANKKDNSGRTPLHLAVEARSLPCCQALLMGKTNVWVSGAGTDSPVKMAHQMECHALVILLLQHEQNKAGSQPKPDVNFPLLLKKALNDRNREVAAGIVESDYWEDSLHLHNASLDDTLPGQVRNDTLPGQERNDTLPRQVRNDTLPGQERNDTLPGKVRNDTLPGQERNDTLSGQERNDTLPGQERNYTLPGQVRNDTLPRQIRNDNLKGLVELYPDLAHTVLDKCCPTTTIHQPHQEDTGRYLVRYLDQVYPTQGRKEAVNSDDEMFDERGKVVMGVKMSGGDHAWRHHHLLECVIRHRRQDLLTHPLVTRWRQYKWRHYVRYLHYTRLVAASSRALFLTFFTLFSWDWTHIYEYKKLNQTLVCTVGERMVGPEVDQLLQKEGYEVNILGQVILALACLTLLLHIYKLAKLRWKWLRTDYVMSLACAITSILFVANITRCSRVTLLREDWQWVAGGMTVMLAWLYVILVALQPLFSPFVYRFNRVIRSLVQKLLFLGVTVMVVYAGYGVVNKGRLGFNSVWNNVTQQWISAIVFLGFFIMVNLVIIDIVTDDRKRKHDYLRNVGFVTLILDYDQLYPYLRRKFYVAWISTQDKKGCATIRCPWSSSKGKDIEDNNIDSDTTCMVEIQRVNKQLKKCRDLNEKSQGSMNKKVDDIQSELKAILEILNKKEKKN